jgi:arylsulfatase A-like enzyme
MTMPNVLVIGADALRADHLGCYGYPRPTSPRIDALAREGALCERVYCPAIPTLPSFTTLYTGQHPITHGIVSHPSNHALAPEAPFLPAQFLRAGYATCAVDSLMRLRGWLGRGYEFYIDPSIRHTMLYLGVTCEDLNHRAIPWLEAHAREPFFLFIHYWDTHWPFVPPERYRRLFYEGNPTDPANRSLEAFWPTLTGRIARDTWLRTADGLVTDAEYVVALYDQEVRYLDDGIADLMGALDRLGLADNTLVVFTADHGLSMTEHGLYFEHLCGLYDSTIHVPLILRWPGRIRPGTRVPGMFQVSDIAPTVLEAVGQPVSPAIEGRSLWPLLAGEGLVPAHDRVISLESTLEAKWAIRTERHKFILARGPDQYGQSRELYDLVSDPTEQRNIAGEAPETAAALEAELEGWIADRLKALGRTEDPIVANGVTIGAVAAP